MTQVLTQDLNIVLRGEGHFEKALALDTSLAQTVYKGMALGIHQSADTIHLAVADGVTWVSTDIFLGISAGYAKVSLGDPETLMPQIYVFPSIVGFPSAALTNAALGSPVYVSAYTATGITLTVTPGAYPKLGTLWLVEGGYAYVLLSVPFPMP